MNSTPPGGLPKLTIRTEFATADSTLSSKLDVSPPPWLEPVRRAWIPMPVHATYGTPGLPALQVVRLEENIAEKISRLNRTTTARDLYDLAWLATHSARSEVSTLLSSDD
jgi:predicted nucleotidyltransferase component of viral defense system